MLIENIIFGSNGLIPVITQDFYSQEVLILAYMNKKSLEKTLKEKVLYYYSRSREKIWKKGESSGHTQILMTLTFDCDCDCVLAKVIQKGPACHTGEQSCFHNNVIKTEKVSHILLALYNLILERKNCKKEASYTSYLFDEGKDKILKKIAEEAGEIIIASKNNSKKELIYEISDFIYHLIVLMVEEGVEFDDVLNELNKRYK